MTGEVGYKKPPVHTQFHRGQSGNPGGRPGPRRAMERGFQTEIEAALRGPPEHLTERDAASVLTNAARQLVLAATRSDGPALKLMLSFLGEPGRKRPRRERLANGKLEALIDACEVAPPEPKAEQSLVPAQSQGIPKIRVPAGDGQFSAHPTG